MRTDVFTARPSRSQSFRDPPLKGQSLFFIGGIDIFGLSLIDSFTSNTDPTLCGIERQRPGSLSSALGAQSHGPSFPALPRPSGVLSRVKYRDITCTFNCKLQFPDVVQQYEAFCWQMLSKIYTLSRRSGFGSSAPDRAVEPKSTETNTLLVLILSWDVLTVTEMQNNGSLNQFLSVLDISLIFATTR